MQKYRMFTGSLFSIRLKSRNAIDPYNLLEPLFKYRKRVFLITV